MKLGKKYFGQFVLRGLVGMGFGPLILAIVYTILGFNGAVTEVGVYEMTVGIFTIALLAFLVGGITVVFQIEELPISKAITLHGIVLYICYAVVYLVNGWIAKGLTPFLVFTAIFIVGYLIVWIVIYLITKKNTENVNQNMKF